MILCHLKKVSLVLLVVVLGPGGNGVLGHVSLSVSEGVFDSSITTEFKVGHGCDGKDTLITTVKIPEGIVNVRPRQMFGYNITVTTRVQDPPAMVYGDMVNTTIDEITWTGLLPDSQYQWFGISMYILPPSTALATQGNEAVVQEQLSTAETEFPLIMTQYCGDGVIMAWDDSSDEHPSPKLYVTAPTDDGGDSHGGHSGHSDTTTTQPDTTASTEASGCFSPRYSSWLAGFIAVIMICIYIGTEV